MESERLREELLEQKSRLTSETEECEIFYTFLSHTRLKKLLVEGKKLKKSYRKVEKSRVFFSLHFFELIPVP